MNRQRSRARDPDLSKAEFEQLAQFRHQVRRFLRFSEEVTRRQGITVLQYQLLLQIKGFPGRDWASVGELAHRLQARHHGVVALISRCESSHLVKRGASASDRRRVEVRLTAKGERCVAELARLHRDELAPRQGEWPLPILTANEADRLERHREQGGEGGSVAS